MSAVGGAASSKASTARNIRTQAANKGADLDKDEIWGNLSDSQKKSFGWAGDPDANNPNTPDSLKKQRKMDAAKNQAAAAYANDARFYGGGPGYANLNQSAKEQYTPGIAQADARVAAAQTNLQQVEQDGQDAVKAARTSVLANNGTTETELNTPNFHTPTNKARIEQEIATAETAAAAAHKPRLDAAQKEKEDATDALKLANAQGEQKYDNAWNNFRRMDDAQQKPYLANARAALTTGGGPPPSMKDVQERAAAMAYNDASDINWAGKDAAAHKKHKTDGVWGSLGRDKQDELIGAHGGVDQAKEAALTQSEASNPAGAEESGKLHAMGTSMQSWGKEDETWNKAFGSEQKMALKATGGDNNAARAYLQGERDAGRPTTRTGKALRSMIDASAPALTGALNVAKPALAIGLCPPLGIGALLLDKRRKARQGNQPPGVP
jgi:hypothetical protein